MDLAHYFENDLERETVKKILSTPRENTAPETILAQNLCRFSNGLALMVKSLGFPVGAGSFGGGASPAQLIVFQRKLGPAQ